MNLTTIIIAAVSLIIGLGLGVLLSRSVSPQAVRSRELNKKLQEKEEELKTYQQDVSEHFIKTAELLRELTRSHQEISEQLATGAMRLTSPSVSRQVHDTALSGLAVDNKFNILSSTPSEPPKDYAPSVPGGVLSESYGLTDLNSDGTTRGLFSTSDSKESDRSDEDDDPTLRVS